MTCKEKLKLEHPERINSACYGECEGCPKQYGYLDNPEYCYSSEHVCAECWNREIPGTEPNPDYIPPASVKKPTETSTYPVKKATDDYIDPVYITIHTNCIDDPAEVIAEVFKYACTVKDRMVNISIQ